jgi:hypothetical protein
MSRRATATALTVIGFLSAGAALATAATAPTIAVPATTTTTSTPTAAPPPAPKPPYVYTGSFSQVTATTATVKAKIDPHGLATEYHFEYGPTTAYDAQTPPAPAGAATTESVVTQTIAGLQPYTTYHYRVIATNAAGTTAGHDAALTTKKIPLSLTLTTAPDPVAFGAPLEVSGALAGTGDAGVPLVLQGDPFPYTRGFHDLTSAESTGPTGTFSFPLAGLLQSTELRVATVAKPVITSAVATELVTVAVTLHVRPAQRRGFVRFFGTVAPSAAGAAVAFERRNSAGRYVPVSGTTARGADGLSRFTRTVRLRRRGLYRAFVEVARGAQISGRSRPVLVR